MKFSTMHLYGAFFICSEFLFFLIVYWKFLWSIDGKKYQTLVLDRTKSMSLMP